MEIVERQWRLHARLSLDLSLGESYIYGTAREPASGHYYAINIQSGRAGIALPRELGVAPGELVEAVFETAWGDKIVAVEQAEVERGGIDDMIEVFIQDDSRLAELAAGGRLPASIAIMKAAGQES